MRINEVEAESPPVASPADRQCSSTRRARVGTKAGRAAAHRLLTAWDLAGIAVLVSLTLGIHLSGALTAGTGMGDSGLLDAAATVWVGVTVLALAALAIRDRPAPRELVAQLGRVWRNPPGDWVAFVLGTALALPMVDMYAPVLFSDADSARIVAAVTHVQDHGIGFLKETQDNLLPQVVFGPAIELRGLAGAKMMAILSVITCIGVIAYLGRRATGSSAAAAAAALSLLALEPVVDRAAALPLYGTMLALGYGGGWLAYRAMTGESARWSCALGAGVCLALAPEAQPVGVLFLPVPLLLIVFTTGWRPAARALVAIYGTVAFVSLPRLWLNLSIGGTSGLTSYRTDYWITKGYVREIQQDFWHYAGVNEPLGEYVTRLPERFIGTLGIFGGVTLAASAVAWFCCSGRARLFVLAVTVYFVLAISVKQVPPFPRYYAPLWPGIALLVGAGFAALARHDTAIRRLALAGGIGIFVLMATISTHRRIDWFEESRQSVIAQPYADLTAMIDDGKGIIGARSHALLNVTAEIPTWGGQFLSEDEYVSYLTWPSDTEVIGMMNEHDIGWVLIHAKRILETEYHNTWLVPHHHQRARHIERIAVSPSFCQVAAVNGYVLFRLGECPATPS